MHGSRENEAGAVQSPPSIQHHAALAVLLCALGVFLCSLRILLTKRWQAHRRLLCTDLSDARCFTPPRAEAGAALVTEFEYNAAAQLQIDLLWGCLVEDFNPVFGLDELVSTACRLASHSCAESALLLFLLALQVALLPSAASSKHELLRRMKVSPLPF